MGGVGAHGPPAVTLARVLKTSTATGGAALGSACESPGPQGFLVEPREAACPPGHFRVWAAPIGARNQV